MTCKAVAKSMEKHGLKSGSFVNIASVTGIFGLEDNSGYSATKGGVIAFTKAISKELIKYAVQCLFSKLIAYITLSYRNCQSDHYY